MRPKSCRFGFCLEPWRWALNKTTRWTWLLRLRPCSAKFVVFAPKTSTQSNKSGRGLKFKWIQQKVTANSERHFNHLIRIVWITLKQTTTWGFLIFDSPQFLYFNVILILWKLCVFLWSKKLCLTKCWNCDWRNECLRSNLKFRGQKPDLHQYSAKLGICQNTRIQTDTMHTYTYMIKMILDLLNWSCGSLSIRVCLGVQSCPSILKMKADYFLNFCLLWMRPLCVFVCECRKC